MVVSSAAPRESAWYCLEELRPLHGAADGVLRAAKLPLLEQLRRTPAEWQPAVIGSRAVAGALELSYSEAAACCDTMHAVRGVHTLTLNTFPRTAETGEPRVCTAVASLSTLRTLKLGQDRDILMSVASPEHSLLRVLTRVAQLAALEMTWGCDRGSLPAPRLVCMPPARRRSRRIRAASLATTPLCLPITLTRLVLEVDDIAYNCENNSCTGSLVRGLTCLSRLADLRFRGPGCGLVHFRGRVEAASFDPVLSHLTALTSLQLDRIHVGATGAEALAPRLRRLSRLAHLRMAGCTDVFQRSAEDATALAALIAHPIGLTALDLSEDRVGNTGAEVLAPALRHLSQLAFLCLDSNDISAAGATALAPALSRLFALTELNLSGNRLGADGAEALAPALGRLSQLAALSLARCRLGAAGAAALVAPLALLTALTVLRLDYNGIGADGAVSLAPALSPLSRLAGLHMSSNKLGAAGAAALAPCMALLTALTQLDLGDNDVGAGGAASLAPALSRLSRLANLTLHLSGIGPAGAAALAPAFGRLTALTLLDLRDSSLGDDGLQQVAPALARLTGLKDLQLGYKVAHDSAVDALCARLPACVWEATDLHRKRLRAERHG